MLIREALLGVIRKSKHARSGKAERTGRGGEREFESF